MHNDEKRPKVGIGVMIFKEGKILLGLRTYSHGKGEYLFPGGHLEYMESFEQCARMETLEEAGIEITNIRFGFLANVTTYEPHHFVHIGLIADWKVGEVKALEPKKIVNWQWYDLNDLPKPMFTMCTLALETIKTGVKYIDL